MGTTSASGSLSEALDKYMVASGWSLRPDERPATPYLRQPAGWQSFREVTKYAKPNFSQHFLQDLLWEIWFFGLMMQKPSG
jgi:hypothetical protein